MDRDDQDDDDSRPGVIVLLIAIGVGGLAAGTAWAAWGLVRAILDAVSP